MSDTRNLPTLAQLHLAPEEAFKNDKLLSILNAPPPHKWIKKNTFASDAEYLPIDKVEFLLDSIFQKWKVSVLSVQQILNSVVVTIRLEYLHPISGEWMHHDGVAAKELQTKSGSGPLKQDLSNISPGALQMAVPIAKSIAIRDAADHLGKIFGRDLNRKGTVDFAGKYSAFEGDHGLGNNGGSINTGAGNNYGGSPDLSNEDPPLI